MTQIRSQSSSLGVVTGRLAPTRDNGRVRDQTFYEAIGGHDTIARIVDRFYDGVSTDPLLRPIYPEEDLTGARERLTMFFEQYWGGPGTYQEQRGHPRLRMRHAPFPVTPKAAERWLVHFRSGLDEVALPPELDAQFWAYVQYAAQFMVNAPGTD
ncbi:MAG: globin [Nocardioidaceae bacterium]|nr:globin [Nocardioidaceae bacterium]